MIDTNLSMVPILEQGMIAQNLLSPHIHREAHAQFRKLDRLLATSQLNCLKMMPHLELSSMQGKADRQVRGCLARLNESPALLKVVASTDFSV